MLVTENVRLLGIRGVHCGSFTARYLIVRDLADSDFDTGNGNFSYGLYAKMIALPDTIEFSVDDYKSLIGKDLCLRFQRDDGTKLDTLISVSSACMCEV